MNELFQNISEVSQNDLALVGGKAANLGVLIKHGFQVPEGLVVTTKVYDLFIQENNLENTIKNNLNSIDYSNLRSIETAASNIQTVIREALLPSEVVEWINISEDVLKLSHIAIRSSATAEDLPTASFAGQQDTYLNIQDKTLILHYIKECYASLWSTRTIVYRNQNSIPNENVKIAVILQTMISASSAGVIFTRSPISLTGDEILIESTYGLGESLVSGQISPDQFIVKHRDSPSLNNRDIVSREVGQKEFKIGSGDIGVKKVALSSEEQNNPSITDKQVLDLATISIQIEKSFNSPQDIEWVYDNKGNLFITQSRPITTRHSTSKMKDPVFWTRGYADDYWNDTTSPLFFDLLGRQLTLIVNTELNSLMGYPKISDKLLHLHRGHVYFNLETLKRKVEYEIPPFLRTNDVLNYFPEGKGFYGKETVRSMPFRLMKRIISEIRIMLHDNSNGSIFQTANSYELWTTDVFQPFCIKFDSLLEEYRKKGEVNSLMELGYSLEILMAKHFRMVRYGIPVHNIGMNLLANYLLTRFIGKNVAVGLYPILISGLWHKAAETNEEVQNFASRIHLDPKILACVRETDSSEIFSKLLTDTNDKNVQNLIHDLKKFFVAYGDRGFTREICYPRWREAPSYVYDQLKALVKDQQIDVAFLKLQTLERRKKVENYVALKIRSTRFGLLKFRLFNAILLFARRYIIFRENQRFNLDKWISRNRNLYLEIGKIFKTKGHLDTENDIFFLYKHEIQKIISPSYVHSNQDTLKLVHRRKEDFFKYEFSIPPKFLHGSREFDDFVPESDDDSVFRGIPASHGMITAKTRVLTNIKEVSTVGTGEILIVQKTDPGWTPVFAKIGGLITETGGILSHGAVVSREYGVPSVTNVYNACKIFKTGMTVKIDGTTGIIKIFKD